MADTGAPWNLPYPLPTDLVRDGADAIKDLAEATADGLDASGGLVAVKYVTKTDTFSASIDEGESAAVTGLSISHAVSNASHRVILISSLTGGTDIGTNTYPFAAFFAANGSQIDPADSPGNRSTSGAINFGSRQEWASSVSLTSVYSPEDTSSITYQVFVRNQETGTKTTFVGRGVSDTNSANRGRHNSHLMLLEVKV